MKLCLGTVQFGMDYGVQGAHRLTYKKIDEIIGYAIRNGIKDFDSAEAYGEAEDILGHYILHRKPEAENIRVVSKLAAGSFGHNALKGQWKDIAVNNASKSVAALGIRKMEAYLFHDASYIYDEDAVKALYEVKNAGLARTVGVSVYTPEEAIKALEYQEIEAIQIPYNVFDHRLDHSGFFKQAKEKDITVYARSILLQGLAVMDIGALPEHMKFAREYLYDFRELCSKYGISPLETAVGYINQHSGIDYIVFGVDSLEQLQGVIAMRNKVIPAQMADELCRQYAEVEEKLVNPTLWKS